MSIRWRLALIGGLWLAGVACAAEDAAREAGRIDEPARTAQRLMAEGAQAAAIEALIEAGHLHRARSQFDAQAAGLAASERAWLAGLLAWQGNDQAAAEKAWAQTDAPHQARAAILQAEADCARGERAAALARLQAIPSTELARLAPDWQFRAKLAALPERPDADSVQRLDGEWAALPEGHRRALLGLRWGERLRQAGQPEAAARVWRESLAVAERAGSLRAQAQLLGVLAEQAADEATLDLLRRGIVAAENAAADEIGFRLHWQLARRLAAAGRGEASLAAYGRAVDALERVRADMVAALPAGLGFRESLGPLYVELADALLRTAENRPEDEAAGLLLSAQNTLERLKQAELQDYFQDDCVNRQLAAGSGLSSLPAGSALLYTVTLPDRLVLLLNADGRLRQKVVPVGAVELNRAAGQLRELLEKRSTREFAAPARRLHGWLIEPLRPWLQAAGVRSLVVVPDGVLRTLPFAALRDGARYLIEDYALAVSPAISLTDLRPLAGERGRGTLIGGLSVSVQGFPALPAVADELGVVRDSFGGRLLYNEEFRTSALADSLNQAPYRVVHLASHGEFGAQARDTFVLTYDQRLDMDGLERLIAAQGSRGAPVELLTLSACQTASGDERAALGLAGVAMKAGAKSALATLWAVNDRAAAELVSRFYQALAQPGASRAEALQTAQRELIAGARFNHPAYWAPFILVGNWL